MISMIVAMDKNGGIGKNNDLLAHIKPDLQYYKRVTMGHPIIMGYNTYMSLPIQPLPHRQNVVITRKPIKIDGAIVLHSIEEALQWIQQQPSQEEVFICGGATIYEQFIPYADRLYITHISNPLTQIPFSQRLKSTGRSKVYRQIVKTLNINIPTFSLFMNEKTCKNCT